MEFLAFVERAQGLSLGGKILGGGVLLMVAIMVSAFGAGWARELRTVKKRPFPKLSEEEAMVLSQSDVKTIKKLRIYFGRLVRCLNENEHSVVMVCFSLSGFFYVVWLLWL